MLHARPGSLLWRLGSYLTVVQNAWLTILIDPWNSLTTDCNYINSLKSFKWPLSLERSPQKFSCVWVCWFFFFQRWWILKGFDTKSLPSPHQQQHVLHAGISTCWSVSHGNFVKMPVSILWNSDAWRGFNNVPYTKIMCRVQHQLSVYG